MTLRRRLFLFVVLLIVLGLPTIAGIFASVYWRIILDQTEQDGKATAQLLAQAISFAQKLPATIEYVISQDVLAVADTVAHLGQIARRQKIPPMEINYALRNIAARNRIPEIWIIDDRGQPLFRSLDDLDAAFDIHANLTSRPVFQDLMAGKAYQIFTDLKRQDLDNQTFYYGGVALPDQSGVALVAGLTDRINPIFQSIGLKRIIDAVMAALPIETIWVFDENLKLVTAVSAEGRQSTTALTDFENDIIEKVLKGSLPTSYLKNQSFYNALFKHATLYVGAPVLGVNGLPSGAVLLSLPVDLKDVLGSILLTGGSLSAVLLLLSMVLALPFLNRIVQPLVRLTVQTHRLVAADFNADQEVHAELLKVSAKRHDEVGSLGHALYTMVTRLKSYIAELKETTAAKERIEGELSAAHAIQMGMLPDSFTLPEHVDCDLYAMLEPAKAIGGDLFDFFMLDENRLFILIADVSDKGVPAALFMAVTKTLFLVEARRDSSSVARIMERVNVNLCQNNPQGMFVTVFAGILDLQSGTIVYADGGHERSVVLRANGQPELIEKRGGLVLGFDPDAVYQEESPIQLAPGEGLLLYTDGVSEAMNIRHEMFTVTRLLETLLPVCQNVPARSVIEHVRTAVKTFVDGYPQSDDITVLVLRWGIAAAHLPQ